jgi:hypothetical protein
MLVLLGDGVGLVGFEPVAPEGVTVVGGAEVGTAAQLASTAVIISAQLTGSARRSPLARRTAPRSRRIHRTSLLAAKAVRTLGLSHRGEDAAAHPHLYAHLVWRTTPCRASPA